jgi:ATP-dependent Clp protease protease subunit
MKKLLTITLLAAGAGLGAIALGLYIRTSIEISTHSIEDLSDVSLDGSPARTIKSESDIKVKSLTLSSDRVVPLIGEIGSNSLMVASNIQRLAALSKAPIFLVINSPGGSVVDGASILSAMKGSRAPVYTVCLQLCASMAFITFEYGVKRYAVDSSVLMSHPASGGARGELDKMVSQLTMIQKYVDEMNKEVARKSNVSFEELKRRSSVEMWLSGKDAVLQGYADEVVYLPTLSGSGVDAPAIENFKINIPSRVKVGW